MKNTKVKDIMTDKPVFVLPHDSLKQAGQKMQENDCGFLPVGTSAHTLGIITDRDIVVRAVAAGKDINSEQVHDCMTARVYGCNEDDFLEDAAERMRAHKISRLIVRNEEGKVSGILSFGGILRKTADAGEVSNVVKHAITKAVA